MSRVRLAVAGVGAWGQHFVRLASRSPRAELVAVVDPDPSAPGRRSLAVPAFERLDDALALGLDAVIVASPARTHRAVACAALEAGVAVLVEKPLAVGSPDAEAIVTLGQRVGCTAMVGHLLRYHPAVRRLIDEVRRGTIGRPRRLHSARRSPPGRASDVSALWALGPHDVSVLLGLDGAPLESLTASSPGDDEVLVQARTASGLGVRFDLSRTSALKERRLTVWGDEGVLSFDDLSSEAPLWLQRLGPGAAGEALVVPTDEPLAAEFEHFVGCVASGTEPLTPASDGLRVVRWLEAVEASLARPAWMQPASG